MEQLYRLTTTRPKPAASSVGALTRQSHPVWPGTLRVALAAATTGLLGMLSFPPYSLVPLVFIVSVPALAVAVRGSLRQAFVVGWLASALGHLGACPWVLPTIARFEEISRVEAAPFFGLFLAYYGLQGGLFTLAACWLTKTVAEPATEQPSFATAQPRRAVEPRLVPTRSATVILATAVASFWVVLEWGFPKPVPWSFGNTLAASAVLRQAADVGGVYGLTFLIVFVNTTLALALTQPRGTPLGERLRSIGVAAVLLLVAATYGTVKLHTLAGETGRRPWTAATEGDPDNGAVAILTPDHRRSRGGSDGLDILVVQGGLESGRHDLSDANEEAWATYSRLTAEAVPPGGAGDAVAVASVSSEPLRPAALPLGRPTGDAPHGAGAGDSAWRAQRAVPDLIVWPETVLRVYLRHDDSYRQRLFALVGSLQRPLFTGALDRPDDRPGEFNSGYLITPASHRSAASTGGPAIALDTSAAPPGGSPPDLQLYHKAKLLPFGEYVPGASWLPFFQWWQTTGLFVSGASGNPPGRLLTLDRDGSRPSLGGRQHLRFAPSICFEVLWPGVFNEAVRKGAGLLINLTDDGWFGDGAGPLQHLQAATLRAVETRRWLVRASNSGVSAFIDPTGRIVSSLPLHAIGLLHHRVEPSLQVPLYVQIGDWPVGASAAFCLAFLAWVWCAHPRVQRLVRRATPLVTAPFHAAFGESTDALGCAVGRAEREPDQ